MQTVTAIVLCLILPSFAADPGEFPEVPAPSALEEAVIKNDVSKVEHLLARGEDVNSSGPNGGRPMIAVAASHRSLAVMKLLVEKHADVNAKGEAGETALMDAAMQADQEDGIECLKFLLDHGAKVDQADDRGHFPIYFAIGHSSKAVKLLLDHGADVNSKTKDGFTLLHECGEVDNSGKAAQVLIDHHANVNAIEDTHGATPLHVAAYAGNLAVVKILTTCGADPSIRDKEGKTARELTKDEEIARILAKQASRK